MVGLFSSYSRPANYLYLKLFILPQSLDLQNRTDSN